MARLSVSTAWNEAAAFVKQEAGVLFAIAFALTVLPAIILRFLLPHLFPAGSLPLRSGSAPDAARLLAALPWILLAFIPVALLSMWGNLAVTMLVLRRENVVGRALAHAARRILPLLGALLVLTIAACILILPVIATIGAGVGKGHWGWPLLLLLILWLALAFLWIRLILIVPVAAAEDAGPIGILRRSWALTAGNFWRLLGFIVLLTIVLLVVLTVSTTIGGIAIALVAGPQTAGSPGALVLALLNGILQAVWTIFLVSALARIYVQLSGGGISSATVFE